MAANITIENMSCLTEAMAKQWLLRVVGELSKKCGYKL